MVFEKNTFLCEAVDVGSFEVGVAHAGEGVGALVIGEDEDDIGPGGGV